jgi:hypothetical protein
VNDLEKETDRARQIAQERPDYWQILLAEELLRSKFSQIRESYNDINSGKTFLPSTGMPAREYIAWLKERLSKLVSLLHSLHETLGEFKVSSGTQVEMTHPLEVKRAVDKVTALSNELLVWEVDFRSIEPPPSFHRIKELMQGIAMECFEQLERIPDELVKPIQQSEIVGGIFTTVLKVNPPRNMQEIVKELERLTNDVALIPGS